jgi:hypothetical protein
VLHYPFCETSIAYYFAQKIQLAGLYIIYVNVFKTDSVLLFGMCEKTHHEHVRLCVVNFKLNNTRNVPPIPSVHHSSAAPVREVSPPRIVLRSTGVVTYIL